MKTWSSNNTVYIIIMLAIIALHVGCKKDICKDCDINPPVINYPVANAGYDQTIILPTDSVYLNADSSTSPGGAIITYQWTKISGPDSITIVNPTAAQTWVTHLEEGYYLIELKVTDSAGLFSKDTVQVTVLAAQQICDPLNRATIPIQLVPVAAIPTPRYRMTMAAAGNKLLLAGGSTEAEDKLFSEVNIYDFGAQTWSTAHLSIVRSDMSVATAGNKIFFVGGEGPGIYPTTRVDIYDAATNTWSFSDLPSTVGLLYSYAAVENEVFFVTDREPFGRVDVYDTSTGVWSAIDLPEHQFGATATTVGDKVYFAGGVVNNHESDVVNIYDNTTGTWSTTSSLSQPKDAMASIYENGEIYWAGGVIGYDPVKDRYIATCKVEIRDVSTGSSSFTGLSAPNDFEGNYSKPIYYNSKIIFYRYNSLDIYDPQSSTWSIGQFPQNVFIVSVQLVNNVLYAISYNNDSFLPEQIWKLQF